MCDLMKQGEDLPTRPVESVDDYDGNRSTSEREASHLARWDLARPKHQDSDALYGVEPSSECLFGMAPRVLGCEAYVQCLSDDRGRIFGIVFKGRSRYFCVCVGPCLGLQLSEYILLLDSPSIHLVERSTPSVVVLVWKLAEVAKC